MSSNASRLPSIPGRPVAMLGRGIYVTVEWTRPEDNDEAADVNGYVIRYSDRRGDNDFDPLDYDEVHVDGIETSFQFTHQLQEWTYYQFAVAATNSVGRGEFSEFSDSVRTGFGK